MNATTPPRWPLLAGAAVCLGFLAFDGLLWAKDKALGVVVRGDDGIGAVDFGGED